MKEAVRTVVTPQNKIVTVNDSFGNPGVKKQQGSTIEIWDFIKLEATKRTYEFFQDVKTKQFPFTNLSDNKLQPQESFVMERGYFTILSIDNATGNIVAQRALALTTDPGFAAGQLQQYIDNSRIMKLLPMRSFFPEFNAEADHALCAVKEFDTQLTLPPLIEFKTQVDFPAGFYTATEGRTDYLGYTLGGPGSLFAPKANF